MTQRLLDRILAFVSGQLEDSQVHLVGDRFAVTRFQFVIGETKVAAGEHLLTIAVIGKRAGLSHQRVDDVAIVDAGCLLADQTIHRLNDRAATHHGDRFSTHSHIDFGSNQAAGNRVGVGANVDRTALADTDAFENVVSVQPMIRQRLQCELFFGKAFRSSRVGVIDDSLNELHVVISAGKVATAT